MECKVEWTPHFVVESLTKSWFNGDYRKHQREVLFDQEKSLLPSTLSLMNENNVKGDNIYLLKCQLKDCRGFVDSQFRCGLCMGVMCQYCFEMQSKDHKCDPSVVETIKAILETTKPCPKCGQHIHRIDGCSHMFCTLCKTSFDYKSGLVLKVKNTSPDYYDHVRNGQIVSSENMTHNYTHLLNAVNKIFGLPIQTQTVTPRHIFHYPNGKTSTNVHDIEIINKKNTMKLLNTTEEDDSKLYIMIDKSEMCDVLVDSGCIQVNDVPDHQFESFFLKATFLNNVVYSHYSKDQNVQDTYRANLRIKFLKKEIDESKWRLLLGRDQRIYEKSHQLCTIIGSLRNTMNDILLKINDITTKQEYYDLLTEYIQKYRLSLYDIFHILDMYSAKDKFLDNCIDTLYFIRIQNYM
jgi:hypothetical protein